MRKNQFRPLSVNLDSAAIDERATGDLAAAQISCNNSR